jgi:hypothetical protein
MPIQDFKLQTGLQVSGSANFTGSVTASAGISGSLIGTASYGQDANLLDGYDNTAFAKLASANIFTQTQTVSGNLFVTASLSASHITASAANLEYLDFVTGAATPVWKAGRVFWDTTHDALAVYSSSSAVTLQLGQESYVKARNQTGVLIPNGTAVKLIGAVGDRPSIALAQATDQSQIFVSVNDIIGLTTEDIPHGSDGFVTTQGIVNGVNTQAFEAGDYLYVSESAGLLTNVAPTAPYDRTVVGVVTRKNTNNGSIFVYTRDPIHFHDLSSVSASTFNFGDTWIYTPKGASGVWINTKQLTGSYGLTGNLNITSNLSASTVTGSFSGSYLGTLNGVQAVAAGTNLTSSIIAGAQFLSLTSSVKTDLTDLTASAGLSGALGLFTNLTGTNISGSNMQYTNITGSYGVIGTTSRNASAVLEVASTTQGILFPRMTGAQKAAITSPATGLIVYQTDTSGSDADGLYIYKSNQWIQII